MVNSFRTASHFFFFRLLFVLLESCLACWATSIYSLSNSTTLVSVSGAYMLTMCGALSITVISNFFHHFPFTFSSPHIYPIFLSPHLHQSISATYAPPPDYPNAFWSMKRRDGQAYASVLGAYFEPCHV